MRHGSSRYVTTCRLDIFLRLSKEWWKTFTSLNTAWVKEIFLTLHSTMTIQWIVLYFTFPGRVTFLNKFIISQSWNSLSLLVVVTSLFILCMQRYNNFFLTYCSDTCSVNKNRIQGLYNKYFIHRNFILSEKC